MTPPPTPSPVKAAGGKKHAIGGCESDDDDVFVPRYDIVSVIIFQNIVCSDNFRLLVLPGTAQKRHVLKSLLLRQRFQSLFTVSLSLMEWCMYLI